MLAVIKIRFSLACWLLVVAGLFAAEAVPLRKNQKKNHPTVSSYATASPAKDPRNPVKESGVSADTTRATGKQESNEEPRANAVTQEPDSGERWRSYKQKFGKKYKSQEEDKSRQSIFENNFGTILSHNEQYDKGLVSFKMGANQFTDMTQEEFSQKMNGHKQTTLTGARSSSPPSTNSNSTQQSLPSTVDWRSKGYVTAVKDQGQCASCWAFSVTGVLEGQIYRSKGLLVSLSEQNLVDCSSSYGNQGCTGGMAGYSYDYIKANGGVDTGASYPYTATQTTCRFNASNVGARVTGYVSLQYGNEQALQQAVATIGPIAIAIDANHRSFQNYQSGIYYETSCKTSVNHAVLVVGYGTLNGADYWIVKNSWGTSWGDNGYVYMSRNLNNQCGIASYSTYPTL